MNKQAIENLQGFLQNMRECGYTDFSVDSDGKFRDKELRRDWLIWKIARHVMYNEVMAEMKKRGQ